MKITVSKEAAKELEVAAAWYEKEQLGLGDRLITGFEYAIQLLRERNPPLISLQGEASSLGGKKLILHKFPFSLITIQLNQTITVVAFAHHSRKPDYWKDRIHT